MRRIGSGIWCIILLVVASTASAVGAQTAPEGLPCYDLAIVMDVAQHLVKVRQIVTWTNRTALPTSQIVFNAHSHYSIPDKDIGFLAKMVEILRMSPRESMSFDGPALQMEEVLYRPVARQIATPPALGAPISESNQDRARGKPNAMGETREWQAPLPQGEKKVVPFHFPADNPTALTVSLPEPVKPGEAVSLDMTYTMKLPPRKGRWGQWDGITTLAQWIPVVAVYSADKGWQPMPFIPWHQPFFNEAGHYTVTVRLPADQKLAASAAVRQERDLGDGWREVLFEPACLRDFALIASAQFKELTAQADGVQVRCLALPGHEFIAKALLDCACETLPVYSRWFGKYPYPVFTIAESSFGWNGNECGGLVMVDDRMFNMPQIAKSYPIYLLQHEMCHQWWYNVVGTNGYAETWMDEGLATYFSHRLANRTLGANNKVLQLPVGFEWVTNIQRDDLRNYGMIGAWARGDAKPCVPKEDEGMPAYGHLVNLMSATYDRGSKVVGMIEERMGEQAFFDFMKHVYCKYAYSILRVKDFQKELETFTGRSWDDFFQYWVYGTGQCDWKVESVRMQGQPLGLLQGPHARPTKVVVQLKQQGGFNEPTTLGIRLREGSAYQIRLPIYPDVPVLYLEEMHATVRCAVEEKDNKPHALVTVEVELPSEPLQISVDPDGLLLDERPTNNHWKTQIRWHLTPLYTQLDEVDVTNAYDRWNFHAGPWVYLSTFTDPWYARSDMAGFRAGVYRTQELDAGAYIAYRSTDRNIVAGADALWDHVLLPNVQIGMNIERAIGSFSNDGVFDSRCVIFSRYILMYSSSMYQPPFEYVEAFAMMQDRALPTLREQANNTDPYNERPSIGINYHKNLMTPYWDAEGGYSLELTYEYGPPILGNPSPFHEVLGQFAFVKGMPHFLGDGHDSSVVSWLYDTRFAFRIGGAAGLPGNGLLFPLGGATSFRGFDLSERQGNMMWVGSVEWRTPLARNLHWDFFDHVIGIRNLYLIPFYDVGNAYVNGRELGTTAEAVGVGFGIDVTWLGLIERSTLRLDVAKSLNTSTPVQFWVGFSHPF
jgi:hypothetical protein